MKTRKDFKYYLNNPYKTGYSEKPVFSYFGEKTDLLGFELEVKNSQAQEHEFCAIPKIALKEYVVKYDSSLGNNGYEIVSAPYSLKSHKNNNYYGMFYKLNSNHTVIDADTGLHVHHSRPDKNINILGQLSKFYACNSEKLKTFSLRYKREKTHALERYRDNDRFFYCRFPSYPIENSQEAYSWFKDEGHYGALNVENSNTVEHRIFASTLDESELLGNLEFVSCAHKLANCYSLTWESLENMSVMGKYYNLNTRLRQLREGLLD